MISRITNLIISCNRFIKKLYFYFKLFDRYWYRLNNKDIDFSEICPLKHYIKYGWKQGRAPSPHFNEEIYKSIAPDFQPGSRSPIEDVIIRLRSGLLRVSDLRRLLRQNATISPARRSLISGLSISGYLKSEVGLGQASDCYS